MKRAPIAALGLVLGLAACRALVGIDDLEGPLPNQPRNDGGNPNNPGDDGGGPGPGPGPVNLDAVDAALAEKCGAGPDCPRCCKDGARALLDVFERGPGEGCLCEDGADRCKTACTPAGGGACTTQPTGGGGGGVGGPSACVICVDDHLSNPNGSCLGACGDNQGCLEGVKCMQACRR